VDRLVLRLSMMPFPMLAPFKDADSSGWGMASRIAVFVMLDYVFDMLASCVYIMACWVTIMEREHWGFAALARACNLVTSVQNQVRDYVIIAHAQSLPAWTIFLHFFVPSDNC
jgi:hypothetical protein